MDLRRSFVALALQSVLMAGGCGQGEPPSNDRNLPTRVLRVDPDPDPAVMAWAGCLDTVTRCIEGGGEVRGCATATACGAGCVTALDRALQGATTREAELDAFESVFISPGAVCRPAETPAP